MAPGEARLVYTPGVELPPELLGQRERLLYWRRLTRSFLAISVASWREAGACDAGRIEGPGCEAPRLISGKSLSRGKSGPRFSSVHVRACLA